MVDDGFLLLGYGCNCLGPSYYFFEEFQGYRGIEFYNVESKEYTTRFVLNDLTKKFGKKFVGLYRDDGLAIIQSKSLRIADKIGKEMHQIFKAHGLRITAEISHQTVNVLDITLNLSVKDICS